MGLLAADLVLYLEIPPEKAAERGGYGGERCYARLHPRAVNCRKNLGPEEDQVNTSAISASRGGSGASNSKQSKYNLLFQ
ncbi:uncharacterized protein LOC114302268 isoform X6 [Camellia sinensis]|uniref:uncharacterized protein LOC114302268 isoform X6 n=1 Tax=Camellia sinensis TaxID=4442 RepID=UPI00103590C9|nr:uncharacterized protein LOC114302268 isoform X6 [Camellia sinensis]